MWYIVCFKDTSKHAFDDVVAKFSDDQWEEATRELRRLNKAHGKCFRLMDH